VILQYQIGLTSLQLQQLLLIKMSRIIIQNATILTLDDQDTFYYPGSIEIRNDKIISIGDWSPDVVPDEYAGETTIIDGTDKLVMPGLVDLHFHTSVAKA
jgi:5-methylthioadenosine/S-adenosylhomocysteine deaminase